jgi:ethanolamine kinase
MDIQLIKKVTSSLKKMQYNFSDKIKLTQLKGGITNKIFLIEFPDNKFIIRKCGNNTERFINRELEYKIIKQLNPFGITRKLLQTFEQGSIESFLEGNSLNIEHLKDTYILSILGRRFSDLHSINILEHHERQPMLWPKLIAWHTQCMELYKDNAEIYPIVNHIGEVIQQKQSEQIESPVVLCHNDLTPANIIYHNSTIKFIDFEYGSYNYRGFDIGNLFCEYAGYHGDWTLLPTKKERKLFYKFYLQTDKEEKLETLDKEVLFFMPISHLFWSCWGFLQNKYSTINYDYLAFAKKRYEGFGLE